MTAPSPAAATRSAIATTRCSPSRRDAPRRFRSHSSRSPGRTPPTSPASAPATAKAPLKKDDWQNATLEGLIAKYGIGYAAYHQMKVDALVESLAETICSASDIVRPEYVQVVLKLVKKWLATEYDTDAEKLKL